MIGEASGPTTDRIDVNSASADELSTRVSGLGPVLARRIVAYREAQGPLTSLDQLVEIQGIGSRLLDSLAPQIALAGPPYVGSPADEPAEAALSEDIDLTVATVPIAGPEPEARTPEQTLGSQDASAETGQAEESGAEKAQEIADADLAADDEMSDEDLAQEAEKALQVVPAYALEEPEDTEPGAPEPESDIIAIQTAEQVSQLAAQELEAEVGEAEIEDLGLYTRSSSGDPLTPWEPAATSAEDAEEAQPEPEAPEAVVETFEESEPDLGDDMAPESETEATAIEAETASEAEAEEERTVAQEATTMTGPVRMEEAEEPVQSQKRRGGFWRGLGLVLLGGLLGVALTLGAAVIWSGTFDYAPRQEVDALNRNLNTMQANQELAWQRVDQLTVSAEEMARKIRQIESFTGRIGAMEEDLASATSELADAKTTLGDLSTNLSELETSLETDMNSLDERVTLTEDQMGAVSTQVNQLEKSFGAVESRMQSIDGFFGSLRDLLVELEGPGTMLAPESDSASE